MILLDELLAGIGFVILFTVLAVWVLKILLDMGGGDDEKM